MVEHPIEGLMRTAMNSIKDMVDVNTIIGDPIETSNGMVIIPISKVSFGFAAGGSEFSGETINEYRKRDKEEEVQYRLPFGGGSGAGVSINPVAFVVVNKDTTKVIPIEHTSAIDKLIDYVPDLLQKANDIVTKVFDNSMNNEKLEDNEIDDKMQEKNKQNIKDNYDEIEKENIKNNSEDNKNNKIESNKKNNKENNIKKSQIINKIETKKKKIKPKENIEIIHYEEINDDETDSEDFGIIDENEFEEYLEDE